MSAAYRIELLDKTHDRAAFSCGVEALDRYLREQAGQDMRRDVATVYVLRSVESPTVLGYYTLSASSIEYTALAPELVRRLPRYDLLPVSLIGRLAVDRQVSGQGLGQSLLLDALYRSFMLRKQIGLMAVAVDAKDDRARQFYERYGFQRYLDQPYRLYLPMKKIEKLFTDVEV